MLEALLEREDVVRLAVNGLEGLELARAHSFDAAIVDIMMPGMDGFTVNELKAMDEDFLLFVTVTAFQSVETAALTAMKRGAFDYIAKPFKNDEVAAWCCATRSSGRACRARTASSSRTSRRTAASLPTSSAAAARCGRCSTW